MSFREKLSKVKLVITDVDGVLTDGKIYYTEHGETIKEFHARDGFAVLMLQKMGIKTAVMSGLGSNALQKRVADLGIEYSFYHVKDKGKVCETIMEDFKLKPEEVVCIGDEIIDLSMFEVCGMSYAVNDAPQYIKEKAKRVLHSKGGEGAFREVVDEIVDAKGLPFTYFV